jgi:hypothetical protein
MKLVSRSDLARLRGVSPAAITKACRGVLAPACKGDRVDVDHPAAKAYLASGKKKRPRKDRRAPRPSKRAPKPAAAKTPKAKPGRKRRSSATAEAPVPPAPKLDGNGFAPELAELTAREISERYGTTRAYVDWLDAHQKLQRARDLWIHNEQAEGRLISRELVETHIFGALETLFRRLLTDATKTITARLYALAKAGTPLEQAELEARNLISKQLRPVKVKAVKVLRRQSADA